jgi:DNA repair protein RadD
VKLRPYQQEIRERVHAAWAAGRKAPCIVLPTGSGKTATFANIVSDYPRPSIVMAHRQELVGQMSLTLGRYGVRHRIIAPDATRRSIEALHMRHLGRRWVDQNASVAAAGVDTLIRRDKSDAFLRSVGMAVVDECFPAGTLIDGKAIESLRVGDMVTAFDEEEGTFHLREVRRLFKNPIPAQMVRVCVAHHVLNCTSGHPFYTRRGWVEAAKLTTDDEVLLHELHAMRERNTELDRDTALSAQEDGQGVLHAEMRVCPPRCTENVAPEAINPGDMQRMRPTISSDRTSGDELEERVPDVLHARLLIQTQIPDQFGNDGPNKSQVRIRAHDRAQSDASGGCATESVGIVASGTSSAETKGRQRETTNESRIEVAGNIGAARILSADHCADWLQFLLSDALQNRLRKRTTENRSGSGRPEPRCKNPPSPRYQERSISHWHRLDSVSFQESDDLGSTNDGFVYNIEVDEFHTYVANGVVVHNCHHLLADNKWGRAIVMLPDNCRILGATATPVRADGKGLGVDSHGLFDELIVGPSMRDMINDGMLTDYRIFAPPTGNLDLSKVATSAGGDFSPKPLSEAMHKSSIVGDVVGSYLRIAPGKRGITFAVDLDHAREIATAYNAHGVAAAVLSSESTTEYRATTMRQFETGKLLQLVNVDILGEGVDVPACEVVSFARPTMSFGLFVQQFGRALRLMIAPELMGRWGEMSRAERLAHIAASEKPVAYIIDHVGNCVDRHGLPDAPRQWSLDARKRGTRNAANDAEPLRTCLNPEIEAGCLFVYPRTEPCCPACGYVPVPAGRGRPEEVDGDLFELDPATLARLRGEADRIMAAPLIPHGADHIVARAIANRHNDRKEAQEVLGDMIALWAGWQNAQGRDDREAYKRFYFGFGVDVATARTLGRPEADALSAKVQSVLDANGVLTCPLN